MFDSSKKARPLFHREMLILHALYFKLLFRGLFLLVLSYDWICKRFVREWFDWQIRENYWQPNFEMLKSSCNPKLIQMLSNSPKIWSAAAPLPWWPPWQAPRLPPFHEPAKISRATSVVTHQEILQKIDKREVFTRYSKLSRGIPFMECFVSSHKFKTFVCFMKCNIFQINFWP